MESAWARLSHGMGEVGSIRPRSLPRQWVDPRSPRVAFIRGSGSLSQSIQGLNPGQTYWLQFYYNAATAAEAALGASVRFGGEELGRFRRSFLCGRRPETYYFQNVVFEPGTSEVCWSL